MNAMLETWSSADSDYESGYFLRNLYVSASVAKRVILRVPSATHEIPQLSAHKKFLLLADQWKKQTGHISKSLYKFMDKNYQQIIAMGPAVIPVILKQLMKKPDHWYWALEMITGENPVEESHKGRIDLMASDWIKWGQANGYISQK